MDVPAPPWLPPCPLSRSAELGEGRDGLRRLLIAFAVLTLLVALLQAGARQPAGAAVPAPGDSAGGCLWIAPIPDAPAQLKLTKFRTIIKC